MASKCTLLRAPFHLACRYLLTYDAVSFHGYLETILASNSSTSSRGLGHYQSLWLLTDAANVIFREAKRRCYTVSSTSRKTTLEQSEDIDDDAEAWEALDDIEGIVGGRIATTVVDSLNEEVKWPKNITPILEELPKWNRLTDVLSEIEEEILRQESQGGWNSKY